MASFMTALPMAALRGAAKSKGGDGHIQGDALGRQRLHCKLPNLMKNFSYPQNMWITLWITKAIWNGLPSIPAFMSI
jgi:hypothetical protein